MIYFDNAATSWPKPASVVDAMVEAVRAGGNPGRSAHAQARSAARRLEHARTIVAEFLNAERPENILFQPGATQAANVLLYGLLQPGDRVCVSSVEHNAIMRPLSRLERRGVQVVKLPVTHEGIVDLDTAEELIAAAPTKAVICQHGSNISGCFQPVGDLADIAHEQEALFLVDGAQVAGHLPVDLSALDADAWFCSGHKGLLGPQGVGILYKRKTLAVPALIAGGTGIGGPSWDESCTDIPECYEAGTGPLPAILGLAAGIEWLEEKSCALGARDTYPNTEWGLYAYENSLIEHLYEGLQKIPGIYILGPLFDKPRLPLISFTLEQVPPDTIAFLLDRDYEIASRSGLHCAPNAHNELKTGVTGAVRLSLGISNTLDEVDEVVRAVKNVAERSG